MISKFNITPDIEAQLEILAYMLKFHDADIRIYLYLVFIFYIQVEVQVWQGSGA